MPARRRSSTSAAAAGCRGSSLGVVRPERALHLVEATARKAAFLRETARADRRRRGRARRAVGGPRAHRRAVARCLRLRLRPRARRAACRRRALPAVRRAGRPRHPVARPVGRRRARCRRPPLRSSGALRALSDAGPARAREGRGDAGSLPTAPGCRCAAAAALSLEPPGPAAPGPLATLAACPASTRSPTRRAGSARRPPRSTSPRASQRPARACCSSTSIRRRTRRAGSACGPGTAARSTYDLLHGATLADIIVPTSVPNLDLAPAHPDLAAAAVELPGRGRP